MAPNAVEQAHPGWAGNPQQIEADCCTMAALTRCGRLPEIDVRREDQRVKRRKPPFQGRGHGFAAHLIGEGARRARAGER